MTRPRLQPVPLPTVHNFIDHYRQRFGRLVAVEYMGSRNSNAQWRCRCDCGAVKIVSSADLRSGNTRSCGCLHSVRMQERFIHGCTGTYYHTWTSMLARCHQTFCKAYYNYGAKGIYVHDRWRYGENGEHGLTLFMRDMGPKPSPKHTLERINNKGPYAPGNCRWATRKEQSRNTSRNVWVVYQGKLMIMSDAMRTAGINISSCRSRQYRRRWTPQEAFDYTLSRLPAQRQNRPRLIRSA